MVSDPFLVGVFFGLVPAMGTLYIVLHRYEGLFLERRAFLSFFLGLAGGLVATLLQLFTGPSSPSLLVQVGFLPLFGTVNAAIMAVVLNSKRFRQRPDTPLYGFALGLGFGAMNVLFFIGYAVAGLPRRDALVDTLLLAYVGLYFIGSILVHACTATWVGRGTSRGGLVGLIVKAAVVETVYLGGFLLLFQSAASTFVPPLALGAAIALMAHVVRHDLDALIPAEVRREMEIHRRRLARARMREATPSNGSAPDEARRDGSPPEAAPGSDPAKPPP